MRSLAYLTAMILEFPLQSGVLVLCGAALGYVIARLTEY